LNAIQALYQLSYSPGPFGLDRRVHPAMAPGEAAEPMSGLFQDQARFDIYFHPGSRSENIPQVHVLEGDRPPSPMAGDR
jgi:hypothetical protein